MGTWLQEGIEDYDRTYTVNPETFTVNGWRELCFGFLKYVEELDLTNSEKLNDKDGYIIDGLDSVESYCEDLLKVVQFLKRLEPPRKYHYGPKKDEEFCKEMIDAIQDDIQEEYEKMWLSQLKDSEEDADV